jgi:Protein of unknown function (DUF402)
VKLFAPGDSVVWRSVDRKERIVQTVWPWTIVTDREDETVLYIPAGTVGKRRSGERGGPGDRFIVRWDGGHADVTWNRTNVVRLYSLGDPYSLWLAFDASTWDLAWRYINLEDPWLRTAIGFDSRDVYLDLVAGPEGDEWEWKDENELAWVVEQGRLDARRAAEIRADGERAVEAVRKRGSLDKWRAWRPDPRWLIPTLPERWREYVP